MLTKTEGIVFRQLPYSETSIICDIFTLEHGLVSYIIGGVRKTNARTSASLLQVMTIVDVLAYHTDRNKLHRIKEMRPAYVYQSMPMDIRKNAILLFMAEVCSKCVKEREQSPELYSTIRESLIALDNADAGFQNFHLAFLINLADQLGFGPEADIDDTMVCFDLFEGRFRPDIPTAHHYYTEETSPLATLIHYARGVGPEPELSRELRNTLIDDLIIFYKIHIESLKEFNSHRVLRAVL